MAILTDLAADLEAKILALPADEQANARSAVIGIYESARGLAKLPDSVMNAFWKLLVTFVPRAVLPGASPPKLIRSIVEGAPRLLGPQVSAMILASLVETRAANGNTRR